MSTDHTALVSKVWNYTHVLRDQGIGYGDHVEQITYLLFPKMDQEHAGSTPRPGSASAWTCRAPSTKARWSATRPR